MPVFVPPEFEDFLETSNLERDEVNAVLKARDAEIDSAINADADEVEELELNPKRPATKRGYATGARVMELLLKRLNKHKEFKDWDDEQVDSLAFLRKIFLQFATFVGSYTKAKDDCHLMPSTQTEYLSQAFNHLAYRFKGKEHIENNQWYTEIYEALSAKAALDAIQRGDPVCQETLGIRRGLLKRIVARILRCKTMTNRYTKRAVVVLLYHAVGRAGEIAKFNLEDLEWDENDSMLWSMWKQVKTLKTGPIGFLPEADGNEWYIDSFHALACQIIADGQNFSTNGDGKTSVFANLAALQERSVSSWVTKILTDLKDEGEVEGLEPKHTSHGLRIGATNDLLLHPLGDIIDTISLGGWSFLKDCMMFGYVTKRLFIARGAKKLAGYQNIQHKVTAPSLDAIYQNVDKEMREKLTNFVDILFMHCEPLKKQPQGLRDVLAASFIRHFNKWSKDCSTRVNDPVWRRVLYSLATVHLEEKTLSDWSEAVEKQFVADNAVTFASSEADAAIVKIIQEDARAKASQIDKLSSEMAELKTSNAEIMKKLIALVAGTNQTLEAANALIHQNAPTTSSSRKRRRVSQHPVPAPPTGAAAEEEANPVPAPGAAEEEAANPAQHPPTGAEEEEEATPAQHPPTGAAAAAPVHLSRTSKAPKADFFAGFKSKKQSSSPSEGAVALLNGQARNNPSPAIPLLREVHQFNAPAVPQIRPDSTEELASKEWTMANCLDIVAREGIDMTTRANADASAANYLFPTPPGLPHNEKKALNTQRSVTKKGYALARKFARAKHLAKWKKLRELGIEYRTSKTMTLTQKTQTQKQCLEIATEIADSFHAYFVEQSGHKKQLRRAAAYGKTMIKYAKDKGIDIGVELG